MSRNVILLLLSTAVLTLGLIGCAPTTDTNAALPPGEAEITTAAVMPMAAGEVGDQAKGALATVEQAAMSSGYPGSDAFAQMEESVMELPGIDNSNETAAFVSPYPGASGIVNPDNPTDSDIVSQGSSVDSGIENTADGVSGSTEGGPAIGGETGIEGALPMPEIELNPETWLVYVNQSYGFQVSYPQEYVIREPEVQIGADTAPASLEIIEFIDPIVAQDGELAMLQPPELAIRIYDNSAGKPLDTWLRDAGKMNPDLGLVGERYDSRAGAGIQICLSTFVAPGCSVFFANGGAVYELTPLGTVGEIMQSTFTFIS